MHHYCNELIFCININIDGHSQIGPANAARAFLRQRIRMIREELYFMWLRDHPDKIPIPKDNLEPHTSWRAD